MQKLSLGEIRIFALYLLGAEIRCAIDFPFFGSTKQTIYLSILGLNLEEIEMLFMSKEAKHEKEEKLRMQQLQESQNYQTHEHKFKL